jgi:hypothetical protein
MNQLVQPRQFADPLDGAPAIARRLASRTGLDVTTEDVKRWMRRETDPLPAMRFCGGVVAEASEVEAWSDRQWALVGKDG